MIPGNAGHQLQRNYTRRNNRFFHIVASISFVAFMFQQLLTELFLSHILVICIYRFGPQNYSRTKLSKFDRPTLARHYICNTNIGQYFWKVFLSLRQKDGILASCLPELEIVQTQVVLIEKCWQCTQTEIYNKHVCSNLYVLPLPSFQSPQLHHC